MNQQLHKGKEGEQKHYEIRPKLIVKFTKDKVYEKIKATLDGEMKELETEYNHEKAQQINRNVCDKVKSLLKDEKLNFKRYKIIVHCIVGEKKGQGIKIGSRCMWDTTCDAAVSASFENDKAYAFCVAYGVYFY